MIKNISGGAYITVSGSSSSMPYISPGANGAGMVRYNGNTQQLEVNDGNSWLSINMAYPTIELSRDAVEVLEWARLERTKQRLLEERIEQNPSLKKAYESVLRAQENFDILDKIVGDDPGLKIKPSMVP
jgi:hypothetical protein